MFIVSMMAQKDAFGEPRLERKRELAQNLHEGAGAGTGTGTGSRNRELGPARTVPA